MRPSFLQPSILDSLIHFFFGTFIGWWIVIVLGVVASGPFIQMAAAYQKRRRYLRNESAKLSNPQNADARYQLAILFFEGRKYRKAEEKIREAIKIAGESSLYPSVPYRFHMLLGDLLYRTQRYEEAAQIYTRIREEKSDVDAGEVSLRVGRCALRCGDLKQALAWFQKSREERTSTLETYYRIAQAAALLNQPEAVRNAWEGFSKTAAHLPAFAKQKRLRWRLAFLTFPLSRYFI